MFINKVAVVYSTLFIISYLNSDDPERFKRFNNILLLFPNSSDFLSFVFC